MIPAARQWFASLGSALLRDELAAANEACRALEAHKRRLQAQLIDERDRVLALEYEVQEAARRILELEARDARYLSRESDVARLQEELAQARAELRAHKDTL